MRKGRKLETLVRALEDHCSNWVGAKVLSPAFLEDKVTGKRREHDVLIEMKQGHHNLKIAIECRDRKRPVGVPDIEAFGRKCEDTRINKGVIVSTSGFAQTAMKKAEQYGVKCLTLSEFEQFSWLSDDACLVEYSRVYGEGTYTYVVDGRWPDLDVSKCKAYFHTGEEITDKSILNFIKIDLRPHLNKAPVVDNKVHFRCMTKGCYLVEQDRADQIPLKAIHIELPFVNQINRHPLSAQVYSDASSGGVIAEVASAPIAIDSKTYRLAIINSDEGRSIRLIED